MESGRPERSSDYMNDAQLPAVSRLQSPVGPFQMIVSAGH
jgi:hypothetical protein